MHGDSPHFECLVIFAAYLQYICELLQYSVIKYHCLKQDRTTLLLVKWVT